MALHCKNEGSANSFHIAKGSEVHLFLLSGTVVSAGGGGGVGEEELSYSMPWTTLRNSA